MKKICAFLTIIICMFTMLFGSMPLKVEAANAGQFGETLGFDWAYNPRTKTLTITGSDTGFYDSFHDLRSPILDLCDEVEVIILQDCAPIGTMRGAFANLKSLKRVEFDNFDTSKVTNMNAMFYKCSGLTELDLCGFDTSNVTNMAIMFDDCTSLKSVDVSGFTTSKVKSMNAMFSGCKNLESLDVSGFDTSQVEDMSYMFYGCSGLKALDVSDFNTSKVTDMHSMFYDCSGVGALDVSGFDTSQVTDMYGMFYNCANVENLDVSGFDTSQVTDMGYMFSDCTNVVSLDVSGFDTSNVTNMHSMFAVCERLNSLNVRNFDTSQVTNMDSMFSWCSGLTSLDVSYFSTSQVRDMSFMFCCCTYLENLNLSSFDLTNVEQNEEMLEHCIFLEQIKTPKVMPEGCEIGLPQFFIDEYGASINKITKEFCRRTLRVQGNALRDFVKRMYTVALERKADVDGLNFYIERLLAGDSNGACLAESFLCSPEFVNKRHSNEQYIKVLYRTFFDREPEASEVNYWVKKIHSGHSRAYVLAGFVNSVEFDNLCASYGISRGFMRENGKPLNPGIGRFAERLYTVVLERAGEKDGIEFWSLSMANGVCTPKDAAKNFFLSPEYVSKNTSDAKYITTLYKAFMDREPEDGGVEYWQEVLNNGATREQILEGFADSAEFKGIMASFGL